MTYQHEAFDSPPPSVVKRWSTFLFHLFIKYDFLPIVSPPTLSFFFLRVPPSSTVHSCRPPLPAPTPPHSQPLPSCTPVPPPIPGLPSQHTSRRESAQRQAPVTGHYKGDVPFSLSLFMVQSKSSSATSYFMPGAKGLAAVDEMMKPTCNNYISSLLPGKRSSNIPRNE